MKIGIITFHWATNYGAVLQAYALQTFLRKLGHDSLIINYMPRSFEKKFINCIVVKKPWTIKKNLLEYYKEQAFKSFRKTYLNQTIRYNSLHEMKVNPPKCDVYICGSDQIWNPYFTTGGEGKTTTSYFLDFGDEKTTRIAYAVSFGCTEYTDELKRIVAPVLRQFNAISVRENTGREIVLSMGFDNVLLMPDPTLLLSDADYDDLLDLPVNYDEGSSYFYVIHDHQFTISKIERFFRDGLRERIVSTKKLRYSLIDIKGWLSYIKYSKYVVTNSFHGVVFSIIYKKQFIAVPVEGPTSGMNDRIFTLLKQLGLQDRILDNCEPKRITDLLSKHINWDTVEIKVKFLLDEANMFLSQSMQSDVIHGYKPTQKFLTEVGA
jgi:hypothetical protein